MGAANAYLGVIPSFSDKDLAQVSGRIAAHETMHYAVSRIISHDRGWRLLRLLSATLQSA